MHGNGNGRTRRTKVRGKPGIYFREVKDAALVAVKGKLHSGVRVAPSRRTFAELSEEWFAQLNVSERTRVSYGSNLRLYLLPRFGRRRAQDVTVDDVASLIASMEKAGKAGWTQHGVLTTLSSMMSWAVRRGIVPLNPVRQLERAERPKTGRKTPCIFERNEIARLIESASPSYRALIATGVFSGLRLMELLGLRWQDVDFEHGYIRVRHQLRRDGLGLKRLKTDAGQRDVVLFDQLASVLRRHRAASAYSQPHDYVFASEAGTPLNYRNVQQRAFHRAVEHAGLAAGRDAKPVFHDLRHTLASLLIAQRLDVVFISRQLGHASPATTLHIYAHLFDKLRHADDMRDVLSAEFGSLLLATDAVA